MRGSLSDDMDTAKEGKLTRKDTIDWTKWLLELREGMRIVYRTSGSYVNKMFDQQNCIEIF
uniref:AlNc14C195G8552 protein n=2 Tax=Albugo laibachii Nc14 TaxID=890382 RepID=F0WQ71_9STRA|nr:AlNc14C195G8552 [Albugo laibachii Nc14]CCA26693.1 AlNc14C403G11390 [Albugo laibachii Nc14]|eukprot:CCA26693.1 AlNc14C403G11390 [Albugo laibachii Nc14]